jgi:hypothetical protein
LIVAAGGLYTGFESFRILSSAEIQNALQSGLKAVGKMAELSLVGADDIDVNSIVLAAEK